MKRGPQPMAVTIAERLAEQQPFRMRVLRRQYGLPEYRPLLAGDDVPVDYDRLMRETPRPGRAGEGQ